VAMTILSDCVLYCEHVHRNAITVNDVVHALKRNGRPVYGMLLSVRRLRSIGSHLLSRSERWRTDASILELMRNANGKSVCGHSNVVRNAVATSLSSSAGRQLGVR
jgi:hypothetical protein